MIQTGLQRNLFISVVCHVMFFLFFGFSFGQKLTAGHYSSVVFWGQILNSYDFIRIIPPVFSDIGELFVVNSVKALKPPSDNKNSFVPGSPYLKPPVAVSSLQVKQDLSPPISIPHVPKKKETAITFHPLLPQHFTLYFKDRQTAHIEVMFNVVSTQEQVHPIMLQRKISSGNLEADLLSMRYIGHYLFIQEKRFVPDTWHTVKIDLSP